FPVRSFTPPQAAGNALAIAVQFAEFSRTSDPAYLDQVDDPVWRQHVFRRDGSRRILKRRPNGDCIFLTPHGCLLAMEVRPLLCRLHPFTYTADQIDNEPDGDCPRHLLVAGESVFGAIHTSMELARQWHRQLYEEIIADGNDNRTDLRPSLRVPGGRFFRRRDRRVRP
ncbi:YkgJ family cysteine cluster protein, partial [Desulfosarcina sp.]|uniref:YkgJ family cysteine cluster protein n=1 Tax=Desulfosarcina sp. TaxID=2027861 RepID=UPI00397057A4